MTAKTGAEPVSLLAGWTLRRIDGDVTLKLDFPNDIHSALLAEGLIGDPYWRDTEISLDWVHESEWIAERTFSVAEPIERRYVLALDGVDCHAKVMLNGKTIGNLANRFRRYALDVSEALHTGENRLEIRFLSNSAVAKKKAGALAFPVPHISWNNRLPHYNLLRKPQCDAGWDWNIALSPLGVHGDVQLQKADPVLLQDVALRQHHGPEGVRLEAVVYGKAAGIAETDASLTVDGKTASTLATFYPGENRVVLSVLIENPRLWWPAGHGAQEMYNVEVRLGSETRRFRTGLRTVHLVNTPDDIGNRFAFHVNGREIFMRGANWIPANALPARATKEAVADLLDSAVDANMNMIRVWGGGTYEPDWFYEMCSDRGLLVWQDFMFSCNLYPAHERAWLNDVRIEARQQVRRLSKHPSLAVWCGDNELVGAISWFEESKNDRDRYLAIYARLNAALEEIVEDEATGIPWWPSSPCVGPLNYGDSWHDDTSGDMHFWDVWHEAKDFEHYRTVRPRFCSEFGFQSFPSPALIGTFTEPEDRNVSSRVMDVHQRNDGGNSRIVETLARYFRFPETFEEMCWLSQVSQGLAMKTAIEFWRSSKPRCTGTLYWQLNDTWPVASWASLEYGGAWKLVHYMARRFFAPVLVTAQPDGDDIVLLAVNDTPEPLSLSVAATKVDFSGAMTHAATWTCTASPARAVEIARLPATALMPQEFLHFTWQDAEGYHAGENDYLPSRPKAYDLGTPEISVVRDGDTLTLTTDRPALYVTSDLGGANVLSDNCFTLLPGKPKTLAVTRSRNGLRGDETLRWLKG